MAKEKNGEEDLDYIICKIKIFGNWKAKEEDVRNFNLNATNI